MSRSAALADCLWRATMHSMKNKNINLRPGELSVDRYIPQATEEAREEAYANLRALVALLVRIDERLALEEREQCDSIES
jgi:hypothetical protein